MNKTRILIESIIHRLKEEKDETSGLLDFSKMKKVGHAMGSNPGGVYEDASGKRWYGKESKSNDHAKNEMTAVHLYRKMGVPMLDHQIVHFGNGRLGTASPMEKITNFDPNNSQHISDIRKHFAAHSLLSNWDTVGLENDNQAITHRGMTTLDVGGSLNYRAQGAPKGKFFGEDAGEWDTFRDHGMNPQAAHVFAGMKPHEMVKSAKTVANLKDSDIHNIVMKHGPGSEHDKQLMSDKLKERKRSIIDRSNMLSLKHNLSTISPIEEKE
jgi:hypothetical protein